MLYYWDLSLIQRTKVKKQVEIYMWALHHEFVLFQQSRNCFCYVPDNEIEGYILGWTTPFIIVQVTLLILYQKVTSNYMLVFKRLHLNLLNIVTLSTVKAIFGDPPNIPQQHINVWLQILYCFSKGYIWTSWTLWFCWPSSSFLDI